MHRVQCITCSASPTLVRHLHTSLFSFHWSFSQPSLTQHKDTPAANPQLTRTETKDALVGPPQSNPARTDSLWAIRREDCSQNTGARQSGMIPGCISGLSPETGTDSNELIFLQKKQIWGIITAIGQRPFLCRIYDIEIHAGPESEDVIVRQKVCPRKIYFLKGYRKILNMAFVKVRPDVKLRLHIPLKFSGRTDCPGLIQGGSLRILKTGVSCYCFPDQIPPYIEVNVSKLNIGDRILIRDLNVDLQFKRQEPQMVCEIVKRVVNAKAKYWCKR